MQLEEVPPSMPDGLYMVIPVKPYEVTSLIAWCQPQGFALLADSDGPLEALLCLAGAGRGADLSDASNGAGRGGLPAVGGLKWKEAS